ncbi:unnamed protein product, partial [Protopolystoma xenopodis]
MCAVVDLTCCWQMQVLHVANLHYCIILSARHSSACLLPSEHALLGVLLSACLLVHGMCRLMPSIHPFARLCISLCIAVATGLSCLLADWRALEPRNFNGVGFDPPLRSNSGRPLAILPLLPTHHKSACTPRDGSVQIGHKTLVVVVSESAESRLCASSLCRQVVRRHCRRRCSAHPSVKGWRAEGEEVPVYEADVSQTPPSSPPPLLSSPAALSTQLASLSHRHWPRPTAAGIDAFAEVTRSGGPTTPGR